MSQSRYRRYLSVLMIGLAAMWPPGDAGVVLGQGAQHNQCDLEFVRRMTVRLDALERQAERIESAVVRGWDIRKKSSVGGTSGPPAGGRMSAGAGGASASRSEEQGRVKVKLSALRGDLEAERKRLAAHRAAHAVQRRNGAPARQALQSRRSIEAGVRRLETAFEKLAEQAGAGRRSTTESGERDEEAR